MNSETSHFEQWAVDWLDGKLDPEKEKMFLSLLNNNPALKDELEFLSGCRLSSPSQIFKNKEKLKKNPFDISDSQFDLLSVASLEKDLTPIQEEELEYIIQSNTKRKEQFISINKLKLNPLPVQFKNKRKLYKETPAGRFRRIAFVTTSVAASIAAIVFLFTLPAKSPEKKDIQAVAVSPIIVADPINKPREQSNPGLSIQVTKAKTQVLAQFIPETTMIQQEEKNFPEQERVVMLEPITVVIAGLSVPPLFNSDENISLQSAPTSTTEEEKLPESKLNPGYLIGKIFKKTNSEKSITGFQIAEAGVDGLNKIFGWDMALEKASDAKGNNKTVSFSSRLIKIKTPARKADQAILASKQ